jgi:hypothetical protein
MSQIAFLIDADNLATGAEVEEAFDHLRRLGTVVLRRAYGGHEKLGGIKDVLKRLAVRSFVNQGRGTTDVALVVDTMDLLHQQRLPAMVAIGSSDADFAPLALRLREAGIQAVCLAQREKADADALEIAYDKVIYLGSSAGASEPAAVAKPSRSSPRKSRTAASPAKSAAAKRPALLPDEVEAVLQAAPALRAGQPVRLNEVSKQLKDAKILGKNAKPTTLLRKLGQHFELTPDTRPSYVQWTGTPGQ